MDHQIKWLFQPITLEQLHPLEMGLETLQFIPNFSLPELGLQLLHLEWIEEIKFLNLLHLRFVLLLKFVVTLKVADLP